jgi:hypothetical protein
MNPAAVEGAQALGVNPANLAVRGGVGELTTGFASMIGGSSFGTLGAALQRGEGSAIGAHAAVLQSGSMEERDASGAATGRFSSFGASAGVSAAWDVGPFRAGVTGKAVRETIGQFRSNTVPAADVGVSFKTGGLSWGAAAVNLGGGLKFGDKTESLPALYSLGVSAPLGGGLRGLAGFSQGSGHTTASLGMEYALGPVSLMLGYRSGGAGNLAAKSQSSSAQTLEGMTGGVGVELNGVRLDYAMSQPAAEWGMSQRVALSFKWGMKEAPARPAPRPAVRRARAMSPESSRVSTGSRRAYDPAPVVPSKKKKVWVE